MPDAKAPAKPHQRATRSYNEEDYDPPPRYDAVDARAGPTASHTRSTSTTLTPADRARSTSPLPPGQRASDGSASDAYYNGDEYDGRYATPRAPYAAPQQSHNTGEYYAQPGPHQSQPSGYAHDPRADSASERERLAYLEGMMHARQYGYGHGQYGRRYGRLSGRRGLLHGSRPPRVGLIGSIVSGIAQRGSGSDANGGSSARAQQDRRAYYDEYERGGHMSRRERRNERHEALSDFIANAGRKH